MELAEMAVGVANLPNQVHRRTVIKGFDFNMLVVGDSGLGKSTFLNMLFQSDLYTEVPYENFNHLKTSTSGFNSSMITLVENAVKLNMELIELNDIDWDVENAEKWAEVVSFITTRLQKQLESESAFSGSDDTGKPRDGRIHCCLYFIPPTGHRLRLVDVCFLKVVSKWVNVVPLIAKSDTLMPAELKAFKQRIREDFETNNIQLYTFPVLSDSDVFQSTTSTPDAPNASPYYNMMPFAITGSLVTEKGEDGASKYVRKYPWGTIKIDDPKHSDFDIFNSLFLKTNMFHMIMSTKSGIYEKYRRSQLMERLGLSDDANASAIGEEPFSSSQISLITHEIVGMEGDRKSEVEQNRKLEQDLEAEYNKQAEEYYKIIAKTEESYKNKLNELQKQLEEQTPNSLKITRKDSKSDKGKKHRLLSRS